MNKDQINKITIEWDIYNWSQAIDFWERNIDVDSFKRGLELGSRRGGLSSYFALKGTNMICSDISSPESAAKGIHSKLGVAEHIQYAELSATELPFYAEFDLICFKSILGAVTANDHIENLQLAIDQIYNALDKDGVLLFSENLYASPLHNFFRKNFVKWGDQWHYLHIDQILESLSDFSSVEYTTIGFFGCFGRTEGQKRFLGKFDKLIERLVPVRNRYIISVVARK